MWGLRQYCDLDLAGRRIFLLHGYGPAFEQQVSELHPFADGILCVSRPLEELIRKLVPGMQRERIDYIAYPIFPPSRQTTQAPVEGRPLVIGYCGRIIIEQKRVDRAPGFLEALERSGLDYRVEFLGDGPEMPRLEDIARGNQRVVLHGRKSGEEYWNIMKHWDALISFSDYEGTPISMLEAMSQGVVPVMPWMGSGADEYAGQLHASLVYEHDDFGTVAQTMLRLSKLPEEEMRGLRAKAIEMVSEHSIEAYMGTFSRFAEKIAGLPRISRKDPPRRPFPLNSISYRWLDRLAKMLRLFKGKPRV